MTQNLVSMSVLYGCVCLDLFATRVGEQAWPDSKFELVVTSTRCLMGSKQPLVLAEASRIGVGGLLKEIEPVL